jgi:hypothetical protein
LVFVDDPTINDDVSIPIPKGFKVCGSHIGATWTVGCVDNEFLCITRKQRGCVSVKNRARDIERWSVPPLHNHHSCIHIKSKSDALAEVLDLCLGRQQPVQISRKRTRYFDPRPLIKVEIVPQVLPLAVRYDGVSDSGEQSDYFQKPLKPDTAPPWRGYFLGFFVVVGISWGWRNDRRVYAAILGMILWAWALVVILPWSGRPF